MNNKKSPRLYWSFFQTIIEFVATLLVEQIENGKENGSWEGG